MLNKEIKAYIDSKYIPTINLQKVNIEIKQTEMIVYLLFFLNCVAIVLMVFFPLIFILIEILLAILLIVNVREEILLIKKRKELENSINKSR